MAYQLAGVRQHQRTALAAGKGFNGKISATLVIINRDTLTFQADITYETGDAAFPSYKITPSDDGGKIRTFGDVDALVRWINGAFSGVTDVSISIPDIEDIAKPFVAPTDPQADALRQKTRFVASRDRAMERETVAQGRVDQAVALGWNAPNAHPALQANYAQLVIEKNTISSYIAFFTAQIMRLDAIIAN